MQCMNDTWAMFNLRQITKQQSHHHYPSLVESVSIYLCDMVVAVIVMMGAQAMKKKSTTSQSW